MDSAKNTNKIKNKIKIKLYKSNTTQEYIYIYIGKKEIRSKMCNRIKKSAKH